MKKILFLFMVFMGLMSSLYALDTEQAGCDIEKSQTINGIECVITTPPDITYTSLEHEYDKIQSYLITQKIEPKHYVLISKQEAIAKVLDKVDICIINRGYSRVTGDVLKI